MKNFKEIEQGTIEWHEIKWGKIGGTLSKGLFVDSDTLFIDISSQMSEDFEMNENFESLDMQNGKEMEPFTHQYIEKYTGISFGKTGWLESEECDLLGISPDGISECEKFAFEGKALGRKAHFVILLEDEIPKEKIPQLVHYFTVNPKLERLFFIAFRPSSIKNFVKELNRDSLVDMGWVKKGKVEEDRGLGVKEYVTSTPDIRTIREWSEIALQRAKELKEKSKKTIEQLKF